MIDDVNFILPIVNIIETLKYDKENVHYSENAEPVISLRNEIILVVDLRTFFKMNKTERKDTELAIIIEHNKRKFAFIIDQIVTQKEVVIKSLGDKLKKIDGISAATILTGGKIGYIIDVDAVINNKREQNIERVEKLKTEINNY